MLLTTPGRPSRGAFASSLRPAALGLAGVLAAVPGVHAFEPWMTPRAAVLVSHGLAVALLAGALLLWRAGRRTARQAAGPSDPTV